MPEAPEIIDVAPPPVVRRNGRAVSTKPGSQISRRPKVKDPLDAWLPATRVTKEQRAQADAAAEQAGMSLNAYIRRTIFGTPGPRAKRRVTVEIQELARIRGGQSKRGGNLNQCAKNLNIIGRLASEGTSRGQLEAMITEMLDLYRAAIAENRATCAEIDRALGLSNDN